MVNGPAATRALRWRPPGRRAPPGGARGVDAATVGPLNTTLVVVATDAGLDPAEASRTATAAHDGLARALDPVHTLADGDTVFALATQRVPLPAVRQERVAVLVAPQAAAARAVETAVADAVRHAAATSTEAVDLPAWTG